MPPVWHAPPVPSKVIQFVTEGALSELTLEQEAEAVVSTLAQFCRASADHESLEVLLHSKPDLVFFNFDDKAMLTLAIERDTFDKYFNRLSVLRQRLRELIYAYIRLGGSCETSLDVELVPKLVVEDDWRLAATLYLAGIGLTNQGRAHSENVAPLDFEGLKFRSEPEKHFYRALKRLGVPFAPLPVFVQGGDEFERREPDFVLLYKGRLCIVEIHGPLSNRSDERLNFLTRNGALLERISDEQCRTREQANDAAQAVLDGFDAQIIRRGVL